MSTMLVHFTRAMPPAIAARVSSEITSEVNRPNGIWRLFTLTKIILAVAVPVDGHQSKDIGASADQDQDKLLFLESGQYGRQMVHDARHRAMEIVARQETI